MDRMQIAEYISLDSLDSSITTHKGLFVVLLEHNRTHPPRMTPFETSVTLSTLPWTGRMLPTMAFSSSDYDIGTILSGDVESSVVSHDPNAVKRDLKSRHINMVMHYQPLRT